MKTIFIFLIFAGFSFQSLISAPLKVESLDEREVLKDPDGKPLRKQSKHHGVSSSIDLLQELGRLDEAVLKRKDNELPAKRDPWRRSNKRWRRKKQKSSKDDQVKASGVKTGTSATNTTIPAKSTQEPSSQTSPATAAHVSTVALTAPGIEGTQQSILLTTLCPTSGPSIGTTKTPKFAIHMYG